MLRVKHISLWLYAAISCYMRLLLLWCLLLSTSVLWLRCSSNCWKILNQRALKAVLLTALPRQVNTWRGACAKSGKTLHTNPLEPDTHAHTHTHSLWFDSGRKSLRFCRQWCNMFTICAVKEQGSLQFPFHFPQVAKGHLAVDNAADNSVVDAFRDACESPDAKKSFSRHDLLTCQALCKPQGFVRQLLQLRWACSVVNEIMLVTSCHGLPV